jgi:hypothetical protein
MDDAIKGARRPTFHWRYFRSKYWLYLLRFLFANSVDIKFSARGPDNIVPREKINEAIQAEHDSQGSARRISAAARPTTGQASPWRSRRRRCAGRLCLA